MEKDHLEMLLEDIQSKFDLVLEGHESLNRKIDDMFDELNRKIDDNSFIIRAVNHKIDAVASDLSAHRRDTEAHVTVCRVKEKVVIDNVWKEKPAEVRAFLLLAREI